VPYGGEADLLHAADQFGATWVVLDANRPDPLADLYANPDSAPHFMVRSAFGPVLVLEIMPD
jgi:hypothetical protein